jgi:hypothetical protein
MRTERDLSLEPRLHSEASQRLKNASKRIKPSKVEALEGP